MPPVPAACARAPDALASIEYDWSDRQLAVHGDRLLFLAYGDLGRRVMAVPRTGGAPEAITGDDDVIAFRAEGEDLLYMTQQGLRRAPLAGGAAESLLDTVAFDAVLADSGVVWTTSDATGHSFEVWHATLRGENPERLYSPEISEGSYTGQTLPPVVGPSTVYQTFVVHDGPLDRYEYKLVAIEAQPLEPTTLLPGIDISAFLHKTFFADDRGLAIAHPKLRSLFRVGGPSPEPRMVPLDGVRDGYELLAATRRGASLYLGVEAVFADRNRYPVVVKTGLDGGATEVVGCLPALPADRAYLGLTISEVVATDGAVFVVGSDSWWTDLTHLYQFPKEVAR